MNFTLSEFSLPSAHGQNPLACYDYRPAIEPVAVFQIIHGMTESIARYEHFIDFLAANGIATVAHDHLGHGNSARCEEDYGFFGSENGYMNLVADARAVTLKARKLYPGLPLTVFAHSMGSFVGRLYMTEYKGADGFPDAFIISGTSGPVRGIGLAIFEAKRTAKKHGERYRSKVINSRISKDYNKRYIKSLSVYDWLTRDEEVIQKYAADKKNTFIFTAAGFADMFTLLKLVSAPSWYAAVPKDARVLLIAGDMDPVGQFGLGVKKVYNSLLKAGVKNAELKLYPECRHELINELNKDEVFADILGFLESVEPARN